MHNQNRVFRVFELIRELSEEPYKNPKQLAEQLKVSERTVYRYVDLVQSLGYKVFKDEEGAYSLAKNLHQIPFTTAELKFIVRRVEESEEVTDTGKSIVNKIENFLPSTNER